MSKLIKLFLVLAGLIVFSSMAVVAQENGSENQQIIEDSSQSFDENSIVLNSPASATTENVRRGSTFFLLLRMIFFLLVVVALIYGILWFFKKTMKPEANDDPFMRIVSSVNVAPGKSVQIVTLTDKYAYMVGVGDDSINLISQIDDVELIQALNLYSDKQRKTSKPKTFADILDIFMPNGPREAGENFLSGAKKSFTEELKRQREKLNGGEE